MLVVDRMRLLERGRTALDRGLGQVEEPLAPFRIARRPIEHIASRLPSTPDIERTCREVLVVPGAVAFKLG